MSIRTYHDFVLFTYGIEEDEAGRIASFKVRVFDSPVGQGEREEIVPGADAYAGHEDWYDHLRGLSAQLEDRTYDRNLDEQRRVGTELGQLLLPSRARKLLQRSYNWLKPDEGLRLRLRLEHELADLPWEYVYLNDSDYDQSSLRGFVALNPRISIVRHEALEVRPGEFAEPRQPDRLPEGIEWLPPSAAVDQRRIVVAMATPRPYHAYPPLKRLPQEQVEIREALDRIKGIQATYLPEYNEPDDYAERHGATFETLQETLTPTADVFHFSGHGEFEKQVGPGGEIQGRGWLILANEENQAEPKPADEIRNLIEDSDVGLVVLGACESARRDRFHKLSSVSVSLLQGRIPCVVAMQFRIHDALAATFMEAFYEALVAGLHIDEAVALGRATVWNRTQSDGSYRRDWGVPVLYLRAPGGRIFPPVTDEQARQRAERRSGERFDLNRAWWDWMAEGAVATPAQLRRLAAAGDDIQLAPVQVLLLLRSAVQGDASPAPWISRLRQLRGEVLSLVGKNEGHVSEARAHARKILGLEKRNGLGRRRTLASLAQSAVHHPDGVTRQTAALAVTALDRDPKEGLQKLEGVLDESARRPRRRGPWPGRWWRRAELRGTLADADPQVEKLNRHLEPWDRLGAWLWRVQRRVRRDGRRLLALLAGGTLGAAIGLGALRFVIAVLGEDVLPVVQFALYSYWGGIVGFGLCLGTLLTDPFLLQQVRVGPEDRKERADPRRFLLAVALGTLFSGGALFVLAWLTGLKVVGRPLVAPLGFLFGLGISLAAYGQPAAGLRMGFGSWILRLGAAVSSSVVTQRIFDVTRDMGLAIAIAWPHTRYSAYFSAVLRRWWPGLTARVPDWAYLLGLLDAALVGAALATGITVGLNLAASRLSERRPRRMAKTEGGNR